LHLSASEPRIFPGLVSRKQRQDSVVRKSSQSENDDLASIGTSRRGESSIKGKERKVDEDDEEEETSDYEMEEAGGSDN